MKKLVYGTLFLALIGISFVGCKKSKFTPINQNDNAKEVQTLKSVQNTTRSTDGKILIFNSLADYESVWTVNETDIVQSDANLQQFIDGLSTLNYAKFKSSTKFSALKDLNLVNEFPSLIFELLNKDGAIQVGSHVFYFDFIERYGYAIKVEDKASSYSDLINGNISNTKVQKYNWEDEMILWANDPAAKIGCSENNANTGESTKLYTDKIEWAFLLNGNVFQNTVNASVQYKKFDGELKVKYRWTPGGWDYYSKVVIREKTQNLSGSTGGQITYTANWTTANIPVKLEWQRRYKLKCKEDTGYQSLNNFGTGIATGQSWYGIRACTKYIMGANAYAQINGNWVLMAFDVPSANVNGTLYQVGINQGY
jgi:hypothetical protein